MSLRKGRGHLLGVIGVCLLAFATGSRGAPNDAADACRTWRDFGRLLLWQLGTGRCPSAAWLGRELEVVDPDSGRAVRIAETVLTKTLNGYGQDAIALEGQIPLDVNPQCLLGLYCVERFPGTQLEKWGRRQFEQCVERACSVAMAGAGEAWRAQREAALLAAEKDRRGPFGGKVLGPAEVPYVCLYLAGKARSAAAQHQATERLARSLCNEYGLEPGLRQYLILFDQGYSREGEWLTVATQWDGIGSQHKAKRLYEQMFRKATSAEEARAASERLARLLISESRQRDAKTVLHLLFQRFPSAECRAPDIRNFLKEFQTDREETSRRFLRELTQATGESQALSLCRFFDALWLPEEAPSQWQTVVSGAQPGTLREPLGRVFLAQALLGAGKIDAAQTALRGLTESVNPFVQAQSMAVSAEIARIKGDVRESARLYSRAVQIDRPTPLPGWYKNLVQVPSGDAGMPIPELRAWVFFLKGWNSLIDGDFGSAADILLPLAADSSSLLDAPRCVLPSTMMLAYLGLGDYAEAEAWGYQALDAGRENDPDDDRIEGLLAKAQDLDAAVCQLTAEVRGTGTDASAASAVFERAVQTCGAGVDLEGFGSRAQIKGEGVPSLYAQAKKRHVTQILEAEYRYIRQQLVEAGRRERVSGLEPLLFAAQVLSENSFDRMEANLGSVTEGEGAKDRAYRFARFAQRIKRPDLMRSALDAAVKEPTVAVSAEALEGIAEMYLAASSHQKAIAAYQMIVRNTQDLQRAQSAQRKIIDIYAEVLKDYGKAIPECERFVQRYPDSPQTSQIEFLMGKLAYLNKDYAGAVGPLDQFRKRYPTHPQEGQAMLLAALSRMAEGNTQEAVGRFREVIRKFPDGDLAARSKFLLGYAQMSEQQYHAAVETFRQLIEQFPNSPYVTQARSLMDRLNKVSQ